MDIDQLRNAWQQQEEKLETTRALNVKILKELKLEHTKSKIKRLLCLPVSTLLFCCFINYVFMRLVSYLFFIYLLSYVFKCAQTLPGQLCRGVQA